MPYGSWLRTRRLGEGLSQTELAEKVGVSHGRISQWEGGDPEPPLDQKRRLAKILGKFEEPADAADQPNMGPSTVGAFGAWLRKVRASKGMSVTQLAEAAAVTPAAIYIESGNSLNPQARTKDRLSRALATLVPEEVGVEAQKEQAIQDLGFLTDFDTYDVDDRPAAAGVYVFYDVSDRPIYIGRSRNIKGRVAEHQDKFWFKYPVVSHASYIIIADKGLRHQVEQILIKFLKSNAVINRQSVDRDGPDA